MAIGLSRQRLYQRLGYTFQDEALADRALTHRGAGNDNYERLEFLGDSILGLCVSDYLFRQYPAASDGELTVLRSQIVKGQTLAQVARSLDLGEHLILGQAELKSGVFRRSSVLADVVEALLGAIYLESGLDACRERIHLWFADILNNISLEDFRKNSKNVLQEYCQARKLPLPVYEVIDFEENRDPAYRVRCRVKGLPKPTEGAGSSRRAAEMQAAEAAVAELQLD